MIGFLLADCLSGKSQIFFGAQGGISQNILSQETPNQFLTKITRDYGFEGGGILEVTIDKFFQVQIQSDYIQKNYSVIRTGNFFGINSTFKNSYLQFSLAPQIKLGQDRFNAAIGIGIYGAFWLSSKVTGRIPNIFRIHDSLGVGNQILEYFEISPFAIGIDLNPDRDQRVEIGYLIKMHINYRVNRIRFFAMFSFLEALTDHQKKYSEYNIPRFNKTNILSFGGMLELKKNKNVR